MILNITILTNHTLLVLIQGLAGSGSLVVLAATTFENVETMLGFIIIFGIGSVMGMILVGGLVGIPFAFGNRIASVQKIFRFIAGTLSLVIGFNIMYQVGDIILNFFIEKNQKIS